MIIQMSYDSHGPKSGYIDSIHSFSSFLLENPPSTDMKLHLQASIETQDDLHDLMFCLAAIPSGVASLDLVGFVHHIHPDILCEVLRGISNSVKTLRLNKNNFSVLTADEFIAVMSSVDHIEDVDFGSNLFATRTADEIQAIIAETTRPAAVEYFSLEGEERLFHRADLNFREVFSVIGEQVTEFDFGDALESVSDDEIGAVCAGIPTFITHLSYSGVKYSKQELTPQAFIDIVRATEQRRTSFFFECFASVSMIAGGALLVAAALTLQPIVAVGGCGLIAAGLVTGVGLALHGLFSAPHNKHTFLPLPFGNLDMNPSPL